MASVVSACARRHPDDAEDLLPHHDVEVVSALVRERRWRHDRAHEAPVVVATDVREDKSRTGRLRRRHRGEDAYQDERKDACELERHAFPEARSDWTGHPDLPEFDPSSTIFLATSLIA